MNKSQYLDFFKRKAKRLLKDYRDYLDNNSDDPEMPVLISNMIEKFGDQATLMNAQHIIAQSADFKKWEELIHADLNELERAKNYLETDEDCVFVDLGGSFMMGSEDLFFDGNNTEDSDTNEFNISQNEVKPLKDFSEKEKQKILSEQPFEINPKKQVECLHCGERFLLEEANVERTKNSDRIVCKYYSKNCNGELWDLISANELDEYEKNRKR